MASKIATILGNSKTRTMVLLVVGILLFGVVIAVSQSGGDTDTAAKERPSKTTDVPNQVKSTPGSQVTRKYQELQEKANIRGAEEAAKKGTTFIPTLTGNVQGYNDKDFEKQLSGAFDSLGGKCSKEKIAELSKKGMDTSQIILELKSYGCSAATIAALFTPDQIAAALLAEKSCATPKGCGADAVKELKAQGNDNTKIIAALKTNGCKNNDIVTALKTNGATAAEIAIAMKASGATATEIATALKASGSNSAEIATALKASGANIDEIAVALKATGADAVEVANALAKAGFEKNEILAALTKSGFSQMEVARALSALNLAEAGNASLLGQQGVNASAQRLSAQQEAQQLAAYSQQRAGKIQELVAAMESQKKQALDTWGQTPQQLFTQGEWANKREDANGTSGSTGKSGSKNGRGGSSSNEEKKNIILKAGSILFAVLDTGVNSDEKGPIMATVVSGSLKGAKLLGSMTTNTDSETISLSFTAINMPNEANSMGISAVAIDPDTARTALASDVDHHYLYRWGSLLASSFVQGYASAVASSGTTSTSSQGAAGVTTTTTSPAPDAKQQLFSGLAAIGTKWSQVVGQNFDRPITVTIDQGTGIGVLITADLAYGTNPIYYTPPTTSTVAASASPAAPTSSASSQVPGALGNGNGLSGDQRQALWNLLQNQPVTSQAIPGSTVTTTTTMGGGTK